MKKQKLFLLCVCLSIIINGFIRTNAQENKSLKIKGIIVGFDLFSNLTPLYEPFDSPARRVVFAVRIDEIEKGKERSEYIWVHYKHWYYDEMELEDKILRGEEQWLVKLKRETKETNCDGKLRDILAMNAETMDGEKLPPRERFIRTVGGEKDEIPLDEVLPCYVFIPNEFNPPK